MINVLTTKEYSSIKKNLSNVRIINVDGHKCKLTLLKGAIKENDFVISKYRFLDMDENGVYDPKSFEPFDVEIDRIVLTNIGTDSTPCIVLGLTSGGICDKALKQMYSLVKVELVNS